MRVSISGVASRFCSQATEIFFSRVTLFIITKLRDTIFVMQKQNFSPFFFNFRFYGDKVWIMNCHTLAMSYLYDPSSRKIFLIVAKYFKGPFVMENLSDINYSINNKKLLTFSFWFVDINFWILVCFYKLITIFIL